MSITPLTTHIGAEISGIKLTDVNHDQFTQIYAAFLKYKVIFFRDQSLTPEQQLVFAARFGEIEKPHPFFPHAEGAPQVSVIETTRGNPPGESFWHTDMTWQKSPPKCSILYGEIIPPEGGDTIWASMEAAFEHLSFEMQQKLLGQLATHGLHAFEGSRYDDIDAEGKSSVVEKSKSIESVLHPLISKHPETGLLSLYINEQFTLKIEGTNETKDSKLLSDLFSHARNQKFQVRFSWQKGSVAIWDNRCTQHFAVTDYGDTPRRLHRVTVIGDEIFPPQG
ncbi:taurine catabolism dioxygenase [Veronia nyctiphanis]|uniref:Taurine catabolism dioxygenase n=1 Tax=Veronia nyctiphanis TaxID=1278244 RepID=A0A4Q0YT59_9GAMM|nr:taurine catabolism dioxygenase [Veronia nyctiphanis]